MKINQFKTIKSNERSTPLTWTFSHRQAEPKRLELVWCKNLPSQTTTITPSSSIENKNADKILKLIGDQRVVTKY